MSTNTRLATLGLAGATLALCGCSHMLPVLGHSSAGPAPHATVAKAAPAAKAKPARAPKHGKPDPAAQADAPRPVTLADRLADARARGAAAPAEAYWPFREAELYAAAGQPDSALGAVRGSLAVNGGYAPALALFSKLEFDAGRHDDAIAVLESARMAAQRGGADLPAELLAGLALHYDAAGRAAEAREAIGAVPKADRADDAAAVAIDLASAGATDPHAVTERAERAAHQQPKSAACRNNVGVARLREGDVDGARQALLAAVELEPQRAAAYYNLAILEKFYALDDAAAARWYAKYRALSNADPDGLGAAIGAGETKDLAEGSKP